MSDSTRTGLATVLMILTLCLSCSSDRCRFTEPEPVGPKMGYIFRGGTQACEGCDFCYYTYWYFESVGDNCVRLVEPNWLSEQRRDIERCYDYTLHTCPESLWASCSDPSLTPRENEEAEEAALWLSGSLVAPADLYDLLAKHLALIRDKYGDSIPEVKVITFRPYLISNDLHIGLGIADYQRFKRGEYHDLDSLNAFFGVTEVRDEIYQSLHLIFRGRYHMWRLREVYARVPSVLIAEPGDQYLFTCRPATVIPWIAE